MTVGTVPLNVGNICGRIFNSITAQAVINPNTISVCSKYMDVFHGFSVWPISTKVGLSASGIDFVHDSIQSNKGESKTHKI